MNEYDSSTDPRNPDNHREHMFCTIPDCTCKEDWDEINLLVAFHHEGLLILDETKKIYQGKTI